METEASFKVVLKSDISGTALIETPSRCHKEKRKTATIAQSRLCESSKEYLISDLSSRSNCTECVS